MTAATLAPPPRPAQIVAKPVRVDDAFDDPQGVLDLIAARAPELANCDAIMLAHFSTSRALAAVTAAVATPVLTAPDAAVDRIRAAIGG